MKNKKQEEEREGQNIRIRTRKIRTTITSSRHNRRTNTRIGRIVN